LLKGAGWGTVHDHLDNARIFRNGDDVMTQLTSKLREPRSYGKITIFFVGQSINGSFSIAMLIYHFGYVENHHFS
jgi:hypothetical protein